MSPRFFSQKMDANDPEKKMPSTAANATMRSPNVALRLPIQFSAQSAFLLMQGIVSTALNRRSLSQKAEVGAIRKEKFAFCITIRRQNYHIQNNVS